MAYACFLSYGIARRHRSDNHLDNTAKQFLLAPCVASGALLQPLDRLTL